MKDNIDKHFAHIVVCKMVKKINKFDAMHILNFLCNLLKKTEMVGIAGTPFVYIIFHPLRYSYKFGYQTNETNFVKESVALVLSAFGQLGVEIFVDSCCLYYEAKKLPLVKIWKNRHPQFLKLCVLNMIFGFNLVIMASSRPIPTECAGEHICPCENDIGFVYYFREDYCNQWFAAHNNTTMIH